MNPNVPSVEPSPILLAGAWFSHSLEQTMARKPEIGNVQLYPDRRLSPEDKNGYVLKFYCPLQGKRIRRNCGTRDRREGRRIQRECAKRLFDGSYEASGGAITEADQRHVRPIAMSK